MSIPEVAHHVHSWHPWSGQRLDLSDGTSLTWEPDEFGIMTVRTDPGRVVSVQMMVVNWRIVTSDSDQSMSQNGGWCYFGRDNATLARALIAARDFTPDMDDPVGYDKRAF
ncbi:hypothetical protein [Nocardiopsis synnemataformans]|uniref:hypothetical protein n=1 Tax=Nocardiopsis synnemataformans TaxID=61305 RepID=UPI003EBBFBFB